MDAQEKWISDIESSLDAVKPADANPYFYTRLTNKISKLQVERVSPGLTWLAATSLILLFFLNIMIMNFRTSNPDKTKNELQRLSRELPLMNVNPINYN